MNSNITKLNNAEIHVCAMGYKLIKLIHSLPPATSNFVTKEILPLLDMAATDVKSVANCLQRHKKIDEIRKQQMKPALKRKVPDTFSVQMYSPSKKARESPCTSTSSLNTPVCSGK